MQTYEQMLGFDEDMDELSSALKTVFLRDETGQRALEYLLLELKFLEPCQTEGDMALNNKAKDILALVYGHRVAEQGFLGIFRRLFRKKNA